MAKGAGDCNDQYLLIEQVLQCPICMEVPIGHVALCTSGHSFCKSCFSNISKCPVCNLSLSLLRNHLLEEVVQQSAAFKGIEGHGNSEIKKMFGKIEGILQCPMCFKVPTGNVIFCENGHSICASCEQCMETCLCESSFTEARNFIIEEFIRTIPFFKYEKAEPEKTENPMPEIRVHAASRLCQVKLPAGLFPCPLGCCPRSGAHFRSGVMFAHVAKKHKKYYSKVCSITHMYEVAFKALVFRPNFKHPQAIHITNMGMFFLLLHIIDGNILGSVVMVATEENAAEFKYNIAITKNSTSRKIVSSRNEVLVCNTANVSLTVNKSNILPNWIYIKKRDHKLREGDTFECHMMLRRESMKKI